MPHDKIRQRLIKMCHDFLVANCRGCTIDAIQASNYMLQLWGYAIDHHDFSLALDEMSFCSQATIAPGNIDGFTQYVIK